MKSNAEVVIIGGGITGCSLAFMLAKKGMDVVIIEKNYLSSGATGACGAGIRQQWSTKENTELAIKSIKIFETLSKELKYDIGLRQGGYLVILHDEKDIKQAEKNIKMQRSLGLDVDIVNNNEIKKIVPVLDVNGMNSIGGTFCPTDGHANPFKTTFAYARAARRYGTEIYTHTEVVGIDTNEKNIHKIITNKGLIRADMIVNAAGVWSKKIAEMVDVKLPTVPFRKEIMATERLKPLFEAMVISFKDGIYFSQQDEGQIVGGIPIPEEISGYNTIPTFSFLRHMSKTLTRYAPILKNVNMLRHWTGFYDVSPDARPILGPVEGVRNFLQCNGFSGHGFMLSPVISHILSDFIIDGKKSKILEKLSINRFKGKKIYHETYIVG